jgi:hypothetical protein
VAKGSNTEAAKILRSNRNPLNRLARLLNFIHHYDLPAYDFMSSETCAVVQAVQYCEWISRDYIAPFGTSWIDLEYLAVLSALVSGLKTSPSTLGFRTHQAGSLFWILTNISRQSAHLLKSFSLWRTSAQSCYHKLPVAYTTSPTPCISPYSSLSISYSLHPKPAC